MHIRARLLYDQLSFLIEFEFDIHSKGRVFLAPVDLGEMFLHLIHRLLQPLALVYVQNGLAFFHLVGVADVLRFEFSVGTDR